MGGGSRDRFPLKHRLHSRSLILSACEHLWYLVLFLIGLLDERARNLVELAESRNNPDGLRTALLRSLWRDTRTRQVMIFAEAE